MEKVLYDIYLAEAAINTNYAVFSSDSTRRQEFLNSVLEKHKITEAVLDSSLAWYSGHLEKYFKINENLNKRFTEASEKLRNKEEIEKKLSISAENDGSSLLVEKKRFLLRPVDLLHNAYTFKSDTTLSRYGGFYELQFNILGIPVSLHPVVTLCVQCRDTTFVKRDTISRNGLFVTSVDIKSKQAQNLYGSIYFPEVYPRMTIFIQDFNLSHSFSSRTKKNIEALSVQE
jgi:hypothetical protein